jgi:peptidoglycan/LPS O-acetylase OafA/YrhL
MIDNQSPLLPENSPTEQLQRAPGRKKSRSTFVLPLQSVRALAALVVAAFHSIQMVRFGRAQDWGVDFAQNIFNGRSAVFVFFIISGFVLGLTLENRPRNLATCQGFIWRRFKRLFPAIFFSACVYGLYYLFLYQPHIYSPEMPFRFPPHQPTWREWIANALLISHSFNGVMWSLQVEALFSVLLPFMYWLAGGSWKINGLILVALVALYYIFPFSITGNPIASSHYLFICYAGYLLAVFEKPVLAVLSGLSQFMLCVLGGMALAICVATPSLGNHYELFTLATVLVVALIVLKRNPYLFGILDWKPLIWLGTMSYSFYLFNPLFLWSCVTLMWAYVPSKLIVAHPAVTALSMFVCSVALTTPFSFFSYYLCERPFTSAYRKVKEAAST